MEEINIQKNDADQRLDVFLRKTFPKMSSSLMYKAIRNKKIKINRKRCTFNQKLVEGDSILLFLPPDVLEMKERKIEKTACSKVDVVYEDQNILIVNKPYGLRSQCDEKGQDCLVSRIQAYLIKKGEYDPDFEHFFAPTICHRLDRNTTGLVIAAKNASSLRIVNEAIRNRKVKKYYKALVQGTIEPMDITVYIKKVGTKAHVSQTPKEGFLKARTLVKPIREVDGNTWCEIELKTGRFHQIRSSLSFVGHPLVSDVKYGSSKKKSSYQLQAYRLDLSQVELPLAKKIFEI